LATGRRHLQHRRKLPRNANKKAVKTSLTKEVRAARKMVLDPIVTKLFNEKLKSKDHVLKKNAFKHS